jgi:DNA-binding NarL/FixJ family response regulator
VDTVRMATTGTEALRLAREAPPDVVVLDLTLGSESGLNLIAPLLELPAPPRVLVLTMSADHDDARDAVRRGAAGYVLKDDGPDQVLAAIRVVAGGGTAFSAGASQAVIPPARGELLRLAERDRQLLGLLAKGMTTEQIARSLFLSPKTVRNRLSQLYRTLGVGNRAEAVAAAHELGM